MSDAEQTTQPTPDQREERLSTPGLIVYGAILFCAFMLKKLPEGLGLFLADKVYDQDSSLIALAIGAVGALMLAVGITQSIGPDRLRDGVAMLKRLGPAAILGAVWGTLPALAGFVLLFNMRPVADWLVAHQEIGLAIYVGLFIVTAGVGLLPTYSQALLAGYAFGVWLGFPAALLGFTGASIIGHVIAKRVSGDRIEREIARSARAQAVRGALVGRGFWPTLGIVTLVRIPPNSPFALTNLVLTAAGVQKRIYVVGTAVGMAPRTLAAVIIGEQITDWSDTTKPRWMIIVGIVITLIVLVVVGQIAAKALARVTGTPEDARDQPDPAT